MTADNAPKSWQRPPFMPGHLANLSGGYRAPRVYGELAELLAAGLLDDRPDLGRYPEAVAAWATAEAQAALMRRHLAERGPLGDDGEPRATLLYWLTRIETVAMKHRAALGLDPTSEARLRRDQAAAAALASSVDLDALAERGRAALDARAAAGLTPPPDLAGRVLDQARATYEVERAAAAVEHTLTAARAEGDPDPDDLTPDRED